MNPPFPSSSVNSTPARLMIPVSAFLTQFTNSFDCFAMGNIRTRAARTAAPIRPFSTFGFIQPGDGRWRFLKAWLGLVDKSDSGFFTYCVTDRSKGYGMKCGEAQASTLWHVTDRPKCTTKPPWRSCEGSSNSSPVPPSTTNQPS